MPCWSSFARSGELPLPRSQRVKTLRKRRRKDPWSKSPLEDAAAAVSDREPTSPAPHLGNLSPRLRENHIPRRSSWPVRETSRSCDLDLEFEVIEPAHEHRFAFWRIADHDHFGLCHG